MLSNSQIETINDWFRLYPPKKGKSQWKCKRSALELARYITDNAQKALAIEETIHCCNIPENGNCQWFAEYETELPGIGEGRNHDMIIFGDGFVIGVEAKADEPFDVCAGQWLKQGENNADKGENRRYRLSELCRLILGEEYCDDYTGLRYQLLSAFAGTVIEAQKKNMKKAVLLVISFISDGCEKGKLDLNTADFDNFTKEAGVKTISLGYGETIKYVGYKAIQGIETYLVKAEVHINPQCDQCLVNNCENRR